MQEFAQFCPSSNIKHKPVIFIRTGINPFATMDKLVILYIYDTIANRIIEIGLQTQGMEDIISAIVANINSSFWQIVKNNNRLRSFSRKCNRLKLFNWLTAR